MSASQNPCDIRCQFCGSLILQKGVASVCPPDEAHQLPAMHAKNATTSGDFPMEPCPGVWWCVEDMLQFENVGFSNSVDGVRYLICADCEKGPIGLVAPADGGCARHLVSSARVKVVGDNPEPVAATAVVTG